MAAVSDMMRGGVFGESGSRVVLEEFLTGPEVSVLAFCDGKTLVPMVSSMDHKRAFDANSGPNTGGMGTIAPNPHYTPEMAALCEKTIFTPTVEAMRAEGCPFKGCLYFGLMLTPEGPKTIEYNCRFGDPETQVVLPLLESDLLEIMLAVTEERLDETLVRFKDGNAACVVLASGGYPGKYETGLEISGLDENGGAPGDNVTVYHAGTAYNDGKFLTNGGRVLGVTATGESLQEALDAAYSAVKGISFEGAHYRTDIGKY
jgi:phosphoribosylamine--glycine ligase